MFYFNNDYSEGCHQKVMDALTETNLVQTPGYGEDAYCAAAAEKIRKLCNIAHPVRLVITVGYPKDDVIRPKKRKDIGELVTEI